MDLDNEWYCKNIDWSEFMRVRSPMILIGLDNYMEYEMQAQTISWLDSFAWVVISFLEVTISRVILS